MEEQEEDAEEREETGVAGASALLCSASARAVSSIHTHRQIRWYGERGGGGGTQRRGMVHASACTCRWSLVLLRHTHTQACIRSGLDRQCTCGNSHTHTPREKSSSGKMRGAWSEGMRDESTTDDGTGGSGGRVRMDLCVRRRDRRGGDRCTPHATRACIAPGWTPWMNGERALPGFPTSRPLRKLQTCNRYTMRIWTIRDDPLIHFGAFEISGQHL